MRDADCGGRNYAAEELQAQWNTEASNTADDNKAEVACEETGASLSLGN